MSNNLDNDLDAAIKASLALYEQEQNKRYISHSQTSSVQQQDSELAMALKLSQQVWQQNNNKNITDPNMSCDDNDNEEEEEEEGEEIDYQFNDDDDDDFDNGDWGDEDELIDIDEQRMVIEHKEYDEEDGHDLMQRLKEKRRKEQSKIENFWKCGKCQFLNHPSRAICMMCNMPQLDVVHHILICPKNKLKICVKCKAFVVPYLYDDHVLDCKPLKGIDNASNNQSWYVKLTQCEQNAINHVNSGAMKKSTDNKIL
eukprot:147379_1